MWLYVLSITGDLGSHEWSGLSKVLGLCFVAYNIEIETGEEYGCLGICWERGSKKVLLRTSFLSCVIHFPAPWVIPLHLQNTLLFLPSYFPLQQLLSISKFPFIAKFFRMTLYLFFSLPLSLSFLYSFSP